MNVTMKKTAASVIVALMLAGCSGSSGSGQNPRQSVEPIPTVKAIDYRKQSVKQLEQSATKAQKVLMESQAKLTKVETQITEINRRITTLNQEISVLEKSEKPDANTLKEKRDALAEAKQSLTVQNKMLVVAQQDVKQAQINVTNVQNILIEKKAEQNKPPVVVVPNHSSQSGQSTQSAKPNQSNKPSQPEQPTEPAKSEQPAEPTEAVQPEILPIKEGERVINLVGDSQVRNYSSSGTWHSSILKKGNNKDIKIDLGKLSGGKLGFHRGIFTTPNLIVEDGSGKEEINYVIINTPYKSYGMLFSNNQDINKRHYSSFFMRKRDASSLIDDVKGSATYKGEVIASIKTYRDVPNIVFQNDGSVTLNADFDKMRISGYLDSNYLGRINLNQTDMKAPPRGFAQYSGIVAENDKILNGRYEGTLNNKETWGYVRISFKKENGVYGNYNSIYGAEKQ